MSRGVRSTLSESSAYPAPVEWGHAPKFIRASAALRSETPSESRSLSCLCDSLLAVSGNGPSGTPIHCAELDPSLAPAPRLPTIQFPSLRASQPYFLNQFLSLCLPLSIFALELFVATQLVSCIITDKVNNIIFNYAFSVSSFSLIWDCDSHDTFLDI